MQSKWIAIIIISLTLVTALFYFNNDVNKSTNLKMLNQVTETTLLHEVKKSSEIKNEIIKIHKAILSKDEPSSKEPQIRPNEWGDLLNAVKEGDYQYIVPFHYANMKCKAVKGYEGLDDFMANYSQNSKMEESFALALFDECSGQPIKSFQDERSLYYSLLELGAKEAEFALGLLSPPQFNERIQMLTSAATWNPEAELIIAESIHESNADEYYKLFWSKIMESKDLTLSIELKRMIMNYEDSLTMEASENVKFLANKWLLSSTEEEKRQLISELGGL
jgi:hypothetical protein